MKEGFAGTKGEFDVVKKNSNVPEVPMIPIGGLKELKVVLPRLMSICGIIVEPDVLCEVSVIRTRSSEGPKKALLLLVIATAASAGFGGKVTTPASTANKRSRVVSAA